MAGRRFSWRTRSFTGGSLKTIFLPLQNALTFLSYPLKREKAAEGVIKSEFFLRLFQSHKNLSQRLSEVVNHKRR
jgi:hypothetical protein